MGHLNESNLPMGVKEEEGGLAGDYAYARAT